jgi:hypothetical protein
MSQEFIDAHYRSGLGFLKGSAPVGDLFPSHLARYVLRDMCLDTFGRGHKTPSCGAWGRIRQVENSPPRGSTSRPEKEGALPVLKKREHFPSCKRGSTSRPAKEGALPVLQNWWRLRRLSRRDRRRKSAHGSHALGQQAAATEAEGALPIGRERRRDHALAYSAVAAAQPQRLV